MGEKSQLCRRRNRRDSIAQRCFYISLRLYCTYGCLFNGGLSKNLILYNGWFWKMRESEAKLASVLAFSTGHRTITRGKWRIMEETRLQVTAVCPKPLNQHLTVWVHFTWNSPFKIIIFLMERRHNTRRATYVSPDFVHSPAPPPGSACINRG